MIPNAKTALIALSSVVLLSLPARATRTPEGYVRIDQGATELLQILESLPYASEGDGPIMYNFEFSECPYCQAKYRDFKGQDLGFNFRRMFVPVSDRTSRETAALGKSRDPADYHAYMMRRKVAPAFDTDNDAIDAYNAIVKAASQDIPAILLRNGWAARGLVFPAFFWIEDGKLFANGGYDRSNFEGMIARAKAGWNDASREFFASVTGKEAGAAGVAAAAAAGSAADSMAGSSPMEMAGAASAPAVRPLDDLTVFFLYHKLSGEPVNFEAIAPNLNTVNRASQFDRANVMASEIATLRSEYEAADPEGTYVIRVGGKLNYDMNRERFESDIFEPGVFLTFSPFRSGSSAHSFFNVRATYADQYQRRVTFANAESGRYIPLPASQARVIDEVARAGTANVDAELTIRFVDTEDSRIDQEKTLRAEVVSVRYEPGAITMRNKSAWPLKDPMALDSATAVAEASGPRAKPVDETLVYYMYHKLSGEPIDFDTISGWLDKVARANQFDKVSVQEEEEAAMRAEYEATDPGETYSLRIQTQLKYDLENERFSIDFFEPGSFLRYHPLAALGVSARSARGQNQIFERKIVFANADSARYVDMPRDQAAAIGSVAQRGATSGSAEVELRFVGTGDPTGAVSGTGIVRAELLSVKFDEFDLPVNIEPYDPNVLKEVSPDKFDIMGLKVGVDLKRLQRDMEKQFGDVGQVGRARNDDPRFVSGVGHDANGCYSFGNKVPETGNVCVRAFADEKGVVRKVVVEQILEGTDWDPIRQALVQKYGAVSFSNRAGNIQHYAWGPEVTKSVAGDYQSQPAYAMTASLSVMQSALDRSMASTRASTNLRIRLIDADWAGPPETEQVEQVPASNVPRL